MRSTAVLCLLPIYLITSILQSQAQPINDTSTNECCIQMTDEKVAEINEIVRKIAEFIAKLAEEYEDFDLSLVKVDVDKHCENEDDDKGTVLELYVNDCAKRVGGYYYDNKIQNNDARQSENENVEGKESLKTDNARESNSTSRAVREIKQSQNEYDSSELNLENVSNNTTKKNTKYQIITNIRKDAFNFVNDVTNNTARQEGRNDESLTTNINRNDKPTGNIGNEEKTDNTTTHQENNTTSLVKNVNNKNESTINIENTTSYDKNTPTDDQADNNITLVKNTTTNENKKMLLNKNVKSTSNNANDTEIDRESYKEKPNKSIGNSNDHDENTSTESDKNNNILSENPKNNDSSNKKSSKIVDCDENKPQQSSNNLDEYKLINYLKKVIRNEVNSINDKKDQESEEFDDDVDINDKNMLAASSKSLDCKPRVSKYGMKSKPQLIKIDIDDNAYDHTFRLTNDILIPTFKTSYYNPWITYLQQQLRIQQQYNMLL